MFMAQLYAQKIKKGTVVTLFPDRGEKYLSTATFES
jgi:cysteine synthase